MYDLRSFGLSDVLDCTSTLRHVGSDVSSMEAAAGSVVRFLYDELVDKQTDRRALSLVRLYKTARYEQLTPDLRSFADELGKGESLAGKPCLTLLATVGDEPAWNDRRRSRGHQAIPLVSVEGLERLPMVAQLVRQLGFEPADVLEPDPTIFRRATGQACGVFFVADAVGSPHVPAQTEFVERHGIRSVLGFGGLLPSGYMFAVVMFSTVDVPPETADMFASLSFSVQLALLPFVGRRLWESDPPPEGDVAWDLTVSQAENAALHRLLDARHDVVLHQALRLEEAARTAEERAEALVRSQSELARSEATKTAILNSALDCVITMDAGGRIVDFNPAAEHTFGYSREDACGRLVAELLVPERLRAKHTDALQRYLRTREAQILGQRVEITALRADGSEIPVELAITEATIEGSPVFSAYVRDIRSRLEDQAALVHAGERYAHIARTLQASLLPPILPSIPGAEVASVYRAAGEGIDVGGDFYDVFQLTADEWGVALGDVMGKGSEAAAVTALARYTLRAAAMRPGARPATVLGDLNDAINRHDTDRFCTVVYGCLEVGAHSCLTVASGGHPPVLIRTGGTTRPLSGDGMLLGPFAEWKGSERHVDLERGDMILLYSDGIVEARRGDTFFGVERLVALLDAHPTLDAHDTVSLIEHAVVDFANTANDDMALVAIRLD